MVHIIVIIDKSGSMENIAHTVISGFNEFLQSQKRVVDASTMTLIEFSDQVTVVFSNRAIADVPQLTPETYRPDGMTALNDAIGEAITNHNTTNQTLMVIITDGQENSSTHFNGGQIQELIQQRTSEGWRFIYLCNNLQTATAGAAMGLASATRGTRNPSTQNLMVDEGTFGKVLSRQVSAAACAYRTTGEVATIDELSSNVSQMNINVISPARASRVRGYPLDTSTNLGNGPLTGSFSGMPAPAPSSTPSGFQWNNMNEDRDEEM